MSVKHPRLRRLRLWLLLKILGGHYDNRRNCGCVDFHPALQKNPVDFRQPGAMFNISGLSRWFGPTFYLVPCDTCKKGLAQFLKGGAR